MATTKRSSKELTPDTPDTALQAAARGTVLEILEGDTLRFFGAGDLSDLSIHVGNELDGRTLEPAEIKTGRDEHGQSYTDIKIPIVLPEADHYLVVDTVFKAESFLFERFQDWRDFSRDRDLQRVAKRMADLYSEIHQNNANGETEATLNTRIANLVTARNNILVKESQPPYVLKAKDNEALDGINASLSGLRKTLTEVKKDPKEIYAEAGANYKDLDETNQAYRLIYLEFCHRLATENGDTKLTWEEWTAQATGEDYRSANAVVDAGNAAYLSADGTRPLTRQERRAKARRSA